MVGTSHFSRSVVGRGLAVQQDCFHIWSKLLLFLLSLMQHPSSSVSTMKEALSATEDDDGKTASQSSVSGVAGRTNYAAWETEVEEVAEKEASQAALGLDGKKYAFSEAHASEKEKLKQVQLTKAILETYRSREASQVQTLTQLLGPVTKENEQTNVPLVSSTSKVHGATIRVTRDRMDAGKRVLTVANTMGTSTKDTIILTQDLSLLEPSMKGSFQSQINARAKSYPDDAENEVVDLAYDRDNGVERKVFGLIKIYLDNLHNCTVWIKCKLISGTVEIHSCHNVIVKIGPEATVATIQADLSSNLNIEFHDAPSGKNPVLAQVGHGKTIAVPESQKLFWGDDADDRIFHAGVSHLRVAVYRDGVCETEINSDYLADGAIKVGNASAQEYQFVTSVVPGQGLCTENVVRTGATTGAGVRAMTEREIANEQRKREESLKKSIDQTSKFIKILDKEGKEVPPIAPCSNKEAVPLPVVAGIPFP
jgi:hypothetical protein